MDNKRIIVIGGLSAGPSAAAKARREDENAEILLFEKTSNISYATCGIPYALSGVIPNRDKLLVVKSDLMRNRFNVDVHLEEEVLDIDVEGHKIITPKGEYQYDKLVFATGARAIVPPVEGLQFTESWSTCRTLADYDKLMAVGLPESTEHVTVVGAGLIGVEVAENLLEAGKKVTLIEGGDQVLPMWEPKFTTMAQKAMEDKGIEVITRGMMSKLVQENGELKAVELQDGRTVNTDYVVLSVGIKPNTEMLTSKGAEALGNGALLVNERMETSLPDIYAAGDNTAIKNTITDEYDYFPLGTHSNKGGRAAGANAVGRDIRVKGAYKTAIVKVFDYTMARTGLNPKYMDARGIAYKKDLIIASSTPGYYPNPKDMIVEMYYEPDTGKILGAELFGEVGVDKRVDVLSTAIYAGLTVEDLPQLDLAYAPPYSPAKDPVVVGGFMSTNSQTEGYEEVDVDELKKVSENLPENTVILDVRTQGEVERTGTVPGATHIDLAELRARIGELNPEHTFYVYCAKGLRGYLASLILKHNGFKNIKNVSGGFGMWMRLGYQVEKPVLMA